MKAHTILRATKDSDNPYRLISRKAMEDARLTFEARGVLAYILVKPDNWRIQVNDLRRAGSTGRDKVYRILNELIAFGYIIRQSDRREDGTMGQTIYLVYENPQIPEKVSPDELVSIQPLPEKPYPVEPDTVEPDTVFQDHNNKEVFTKKEGVTKKESLYNPYSNTNDDDASSFFVKANVDVGGSARGDHAIRSETQRIALLGHTVTAVDLSVGINNWDGFEQWIAQRTDEELRMVCLWCKLVDLRNWEEIEDGKIRIKHPVAFVRDGVEQHKNPSLSRSQIDEVDGAIQAYFEMVEQGLI